RELDLPLHIWRDVDPPHRVAVIGPHRHNLRLQRHPSFDRQFDFDRDSPADWFLMEAFDEGATHTEVVYPYRYRQGRAAAAHERTEDSLVRAQVGHVRWRFHAGLRSVGVTGADVVEWLSVLSARANALRTCRHALLRATRSRSRLNRQP